MKRLILASLVLAVCFIGNVYAETFYVPDDYDNIQAAVLAAWPGDTVIARDGTYTGQGNSFITFPSSGPFTLRSENGPENTIIDLEADENNPKRAFIFRFTIHY